MPGACSLMSLAACFRRAARRVQRQQPAHALVAVQVPDRVLAAAEAGVARRAFAGGAAEQACGHRAALVGRVHVVGLDVVGAAAGRNEVRVRIAQRALQRAGDARHVAGFAFAGDVLQRLRIDLTVAVAVVVRAHVLGEAIEKGLLAIPIFAVEIPLIGSLANIIGIFLGAVVAGIIGAIAINLIEKRIEKSQNIENVKDQISTGNKVLNLQHQVRIVSEAKLEHDKANTANSIKNRHAAASNTMSESLENIAANCKEDKTIQTTLDDIDELLGELEEELL